ncbi:hypothetical protein [Methylomonas sp. 11b]|uniref:hypothetical protein n=1 Tax=Methylomonas sp. 11b TaxID=1168169 RepID=UPI00047CAAD3|nr:hypothetical protein [Methylomonas sp. 11b]
MNALQQNTNTSIDYRQAIQTAEDVMKTLPQVTLEVVHHFSPGIYAREIRIPAGVALTGHIHKTEHLCIISAGLIEIADDNGVKLICAPYTFISKPGDKRLGVTLADTVFTTIHATDKTNIEELESDLVCASHEEYERFFIEQNKIIEGIQ